MRFWDSSALVPLLVAESESGRVADLLRQDAEVIVWWGARLECVSALRRRERDGSLSAADLRRSGDLLNELSASWSEALPTRNVRVLAERALAVHPLHAADALQLAAALAWRQGDPAGAPFVCLDERLRDAAAREGFSPLPSDEGGWA